MSDVLTDQTQVQCSHSGTTTVQPSNTKVKAEGGYVLVESDIHMVSGCSFMKGEEPSPCVQIQWSAAAEKASINGQGVLTNDSVGQCIADDGSPQGVATISNSKKAKAQ